GSKPKHAQRFENLVQLNEVIAAATGFAASGPRTQKLLNSLVKELGPELYVLREASLSDIEASGGALIAEAIRNVRLGNLKIQPGYDGLYGKINIL
ncbi:MAG TPA: DNA helicase UvrD, partial [Clostridia bacterium]|nr:DNA helicase UvrD [Clostridia bacterium]